MGNWSLKTLGYLGRFCKVEISSQGGDGFRAPVWRHDRHEEKIFSLAFLERLRQVQRHCKCTFIHKML